MFSDKLRELRERNGYSMDRLADIYNEKFNGKLNKSTISRYENGLQDPLYTVVRNMARLFNISVDEMIDEQSPILEKPDGFKTNTVGFLISILRHMRKASLTDLDTLTNINYNRLVEIEHFCASVTPEEITELADALGVTEYMIQNSFMPNDMTDQYILKLGRTLNEKDYNLLEQYSKLDIEDKGVIRGEIKQMLKADKYTKADGSPADYFEIAAKGGTIMQSPKKKNETTL